EDQTEHRTGTGTEKLEVRSVDSSFGVHHRCNSQYSVGSIPARNDAVKVRGHPGVASLPVSRSISAKVMPSGTSKAMLGWPAVALFMNCVQIGSAAWLPLSDTG